MSGTERFFEDVGQGRPKAPRKLLPAIMKTGVAGLGGFAAGRLDEWASSWKYTKDYPAIPPIFVFSVAVATEYFASGGSIPEGIFRQVAAGMAGWVGDDLWYGLRDLFGFGTKTWKPQTPYKMGTEVKHEGSVWVASKDIPYPPQAEPGKDSRWVRRAQGFRLRSMEDYRAAAQALLDNEEIWTQFATDQATLFGPDMENLISEQLGAEFHFSDEYRQQVVAKARETLGEVVQAFAQAA